MTHTLEGQFADTAAGHRRLAESAGSERERLHWAAEADRFEALAGLAAESPEAARRAYRPTNAYVED